MENPFLLILVLDKLFKYLPLKDIINLRRVCRLWHVVGNERIEKHIDRIEISFDATPNSVNSIETFLEMSTSFSLDFTNVYTYDWNDEVDLSIPNAQQTNRLFDEYGVHLKVLALNLCGMTNSWKFLLDGLVNKVPNVEQLRLKYSLQTPQTKNKILFCGEKKPELKLKRLILFLKNQFNDATFLSYLFAFSPYLESLEITLGRDHGINPNIDQITVILQILANQGYISNLKELLLNVSDQIIFEILATSFKSAPLEKFWIEILYADLSTLANIETVFDDHKDTLKNLKFCFPCLPFFNRLTFPTMNNLQILYISDWWCFFEGQVHNSWGPFEVLNFGKQFPNLLTLHLIKNPTSGELKFSYFDEMFSEETTPLLTLKNLELPLISKPETLRRLGRIFPNVLKLKLSLQTPDSLRELWTTWTEIKALYITILPYPAYYSNLDSVFTGFVYGDHSRSFPSISHLKELRHLMIDGELYFYRKADVRHLKIGDETAWLVLAEMNSLVSLYISRNRHQISPPHVEYLCAELDMMESKTMMESEDIDLVKYEWLKESRWSIVYDYE